MFRWVEKNACVKNVTNLISAPTEIYRMLTPYSVGFCGRGILEALQMDCCPLGRDWPNQNAQSAMHCIKSRKKCQNPKISIFLWWHLYHSFNFLGTTPKSLDQNMIYLDFYFLLSVYQFRHATDHQTTIQLATGRPTRRHIQAVNIGINDDVNNDDIIWQLWPKRGTMYSDTWSSPGHTCNLLKSDPNWQ